MAVDESIIRSEIVGTGRKLVDLGLVVATWGNISARCQNNIIITPSGTDYFTIEEQELVTLANNGQQIAGQLKPSSEWKVHWNIYISRSDVNAIVHTHSIFATTCSTLGEEIPPLVEDIAMLIGGGIRVAEYRLAGTDQLAEVTAAALGDRNGVLLANHGAVGVGANLREALYACMLIEKAAQIYLTAKQVGEPNIIPEEHVRKLRETYLKSYRQK
ncbi:L-fuculose-phosphate aldolase [Desulfitispora alkaliphila]|uniref:class II aldolase/adducin family protein n=1 Tax=Desulfitispora alkaliphila TaxID=622674 RepID=UPI003D235F16